MKLKISDFEESLQTFPILKQGCIVDTNVIFAESYPNDTYNAWAEEIFEVLRRNSIPVYTNMNVRSEFIDLQRRVLIPECLIGFYEDLSTELEEGLYKKLRELSKNAWNARTNGKPFKFNESEIKEYMRLIGHEPTSEGVSSWTGFCQSYFSPYIEKVWPAAVQKLNINFLGTREIESGEFFDNHPSWDNMISILGESGVGSADAMILNLFKESKLPLLITADKAVKNTLLNSSFVGKYILSP
jgi:predicted nucleic acid-binding protein